ncbi:endo-1,4-beta-xylanase [Micromonospora sp. C51]|uniref:endo-1,4-beta-xylanase n=1 Tax=Micromonospora sp. C51 TaxID=2824879 RepID=UPI001B36B2DF|nr:endo-1,4-beta-xylanase [Micromonospora sp. C51]MBQ1052829.1 endo-1,4-beta-xylanase [Micromonospora sp. C51]
MIDQLSARRDVSRPPPANPVRPPIGRSRSLRLPILLVSLMLVIAALFATGLVLVVKARGGESAEVAGSSPVASEPAAPGRKTLRELTPPGMRIGSAVDGRGLSLDPAYSTLLGTEFNAVTTENAMKWRNLEPLPGVYAWPGADQLVEFAERHGQQVYGHTLVWHSDMPKWVSPEWPAERIRTELRDHVTEVVSRYRGRVWAWDVVNEVLDEDGSLRETLWLRKLGPGYIADAFRWAHAADPGARLFINDYGIERRTRKADALLTLVRDLRRDGVPVDGVGFQSHLAWDEPPRDLSRNLRRFAELGVAVAITELDVRVELPATPEKLKRQAAVYRQVLSSCLAVPACVSFTVWGFTDSRSWIPGYHRGYGAACLFDADLSPKPAYLALVDELSRHAGTTRAGPNPD